MSWSDIGLGSGQHAGVAKGRIVIDTSSFEQARVNVVRASTDMTKSIQQTDAQTKQLTQSTNLLGTAAAAAFGAFVISGLKAADHVRSLERLMVTFVGDTQKAAKVMQDLRAQADRTNQPFLGLVQSARQVLPALRGSVEALDEATMIAQKLALLDPVQGFEGAGLAIREFLSGEYMSLVRRFELSRSELQRIRDQYAGDTEGMLNALNAYITETTHVTDESLTGLSDSGTAAFAALRDEMTLLLAEGFEPILTEGVVPALRAFRDLFREVREGNPELIKIAAVMATIAASSAALGRGIPLLGVGGVSGAGRAGVGVASLYAGANIGIEVTKGLGRATGDERLQRSDLGDAWETAKQAIFIFAYQLIEAHELIADGINNFVFGVDKALITLEYLFDNAISFIENRFEEWGDNARLATLSLEQFLANISIKDPTGKVIDIEFDELLGLDKNAIQREIDAIRNEDYGAELGRSFAENLEEFNASQERAAERFANANDQINETTRDFEQGFGRFLGLIEEEVHQVPQFFIDMAEGIQKALAEAEARRQAESFTEDQVNAWIDFQDRLKAIDDQLRADQEAAQTEHADALLELQADQQQAELDLLTQQANARAELLKRHNEAIEDATDKRRKAETDSVARMNGRLADLRLQAGRNEEEAQISLAQRLQRIWLDLQDKLADAASNLSGRGVFDALRGARRGQRDAGLDASDERGRRQRQLQQQIEDEQQAHVTRLEQARVAETERLDALREGYAEDYAALLDKQEQERQALRDNQARELADLEESLQERLAKLQAHAEQQKQAEEKAFIKTFNALVQAAGQHQNRMIGIQQQGQARAEAELRNWWTRQQQLFHSTTVVDTRPQPGRMGGPLAWPSRQTGGPVDREGLYYLHDKEWVLNPDQTAFMLRAAARGAGMPQPVGMGGSGGDGTRIDHFNPVYNFPSDIGGWSKESLAAFVNRETLTTLRNTLRGHQGKG